MTFSSAFERFSASSALNTTLPEAAPGDAGNPFVKTTFSAFGSKVGCKSCSKVSGLILFKASFFEITLSFTKSTAILIAALVVLFPFLVWSIHNLFF